MERVVKKCEKCGKIGFYDVNANIHGAQGCNGNAVRCNISFEELDTMSRVANDNNFFQAMMDLKEKDLIEYQLKMSQFRTQVRQQEQIKKASRALSSETIKCPTCSSRNVRRISGTARVAGATVFGLFSKTARSQFECRNCGYKW